MNFAYISPKTVPSVTLGVIRAIWGENHENLEAPVIAAYPIEPHDSDAIYHILHDWREMGIADATVETPSGGLLGILLPTGEYFAFCPN